MTKLIAVTTFILILTITSSAFANTALFNLVTLFLYPKDSSNYVQVQGQNQLTRKECETQVFLLSDNKDSNLPFGRSSKWEVVGGDAKLKDGKIVVSRWDSNSVNLSFLCVPIGWSTTDKP